MVSYNGNAIIISYSGWMQWKRLPSFITHLLSRTMRTWSWNGSNHSGFPLWHAVGIFCQPYNVNYSDSCFYQINFIIIFNRQGKIRLTRWYQYMTDKQKASLSQDVVTQILARKRGMCNILELEGRREARGKAIYKRYGTGN